MMMVQNVCLLKGLGSKLGQKGEEKTMTHILQYSCISVIVKPYILYIYILLYTGKYCARHFYCNLHRDLHKELYYLCATSDLVLLKCFCKDNNCNSFEVITGTNSLK